VTGLGRREAFQAQRADALAELLLDLVQFQGDERLLDVGSGLGAVAFALAPRVREVVGVERNEEAVARARELAPENVEFVVGDGESLEFDSFSFDAAASVRALHHTPRPERVISEIVRVVRPSGVILVADQIAPVDPLAALELNAFERIRDPSTSRVLSDTDLRGLFDANNLQLRRSEVVRETRDIEGYLDLAGLEGPDRERARSMAPTGYEAVTAWYVLSR
jgi:ubiquinone/menaquinone biosynthesis C-methylase UbiE